MSQPGQILYYQDFEFPDDHSKKDKLLVILNDADSNALCLVLKTTSQSRRYEGVQKGCNPQKKVFFVPLGWEQCFKVNTYIQLPQIFEIPTENILVGDISGKIRITSSLTANCFKLLKNCLKQFKDDISARHWELIFSSKR
jgi:hypothetical protein